MVYFEDIYAQFLFDVTSITLSCFTDEEIAAQARYLLITAISEFKFPKISLAYAQDNDGKYYFIYPITQKEITVLVYKMNAHWVRYQLLNEDNFTPQYFDGNTRTFSKSAIIAQLNRLQENMDAKADKAEYDYGRVALDGKPAIGGVWQ